MISVNAHAFHLLFIYYALEYSITTKLSLPTEIRHSEQHCGGFSTRESLHYLSLSPSFCLVFYILLEREEKSKRKLTHNQSLTVHRHHLSTVLEYGYLVKRETLSGCNMQPETIHNH